MKSILLWKCLCMENRHACQSKDHPLAWDPLVSEFWGAYFAGLKYEGTFNAEVGSSIWTVIYPASFSEFKP